MANLDYIRIIDAFNNQAFHRCVDLLFPSLEYKFLTKSDVRRIDLKERVSEIVDRYVSTKDKKSAGSLDKYVEALQFYFENYLSCKPNSVANRYRSIGIEMIKAVKAGNKDIETAEDLFMIFLALMRSASPQFDSKAAVDSVLFVVQDSDGELLKQIRDYPFMMPVAPIMKGVIKPAPQSTAQKAFLYLNNALLFCRMMQAQGEFTEEDDSDVKAD